VLPTSARNGVYEGNINFNVRKKEQTSWLHRASTILNPPLLPTDANNVKKRRVIKTF